MTDNALFLHELETRNVTTQEVAKELKMSHQLLMDKLDGKRGFTIDDVLHIQRWLRISAPIMSKIFLQ